MEATSRLQCLGFYTCAYTHMVGTSVVLVYFTDQYLLLEKYHCFTFSITYTNTILKYFIL